MAAGECRCGRTQPQLQGSPGSCGPSTLDGQRLIPTAGHGDTWSDDDPILAVGASGLTVKRKVGYSGYIPPQRTPIMTTAEKINSRFAELKETNKMNSIRVEATTRFNNAKQALRAWANDELFQADETLISSTMVLEKAFSQRTPVPPVCVGLRPTHVVILRWDANKSDWYIHLPNNLAYYARGTYTNASDYS